jgi:hypothetical protein
MDHCSATEIRVATADDDVRLSAFIHDFLSHNGFPFIMVRSDPDFASTGSGSLKRVMFEDDEITQRFRQEWSAQSLGPQAPGARNTRGGKA